MADTEVEVRIEEAAVVRALVPFPQKNVTELGVRELLSLPRVGETRAPLDFAQTGSQLRVKTKNDEAGGFFKLIYRPTEQVPSKASYFGDGNAYRLEAKKYGTKLVVLYDVEREQGGGELQVVNGFFVHFFAPSALQPLAKHIVFVVDGPFLYWQINPSQSQGRAPG